MNEAEYLMKNYGDRGGCYVLLCFHWQIEQETLTTGMKKQRTLRESIMSHENNQ